MIQFKFYYLSKLISALLLQPQPNIVKLLIHPPIMEFR